MKFISYDGKYPNLCSGKLEIEHDGRYLTLQYVLCSGGSVERNKNYDMWTTEGPWDINTFNLPDELKHPGLILELTALVNENIPWGCCGGCI